MPDCYVDQGAYASALGATPDWGVPQEGDGSSKDPATAASVASIAFGAVPASGNFTICGVTFTSPSGVIGAASVDAAANALAGLINASTTTVAAGVAYGTPQLRNLVFARGPSGGAPAGTCQVMMRVGSVTLNHAVNSLVALSHTFTGSPTVVQFSGGSGGCWGWFLNDAALGVSGSIAARTYGLLVSAPMVVATVPTELDDVIVRTGRNITISSGNWATQTSRLNPISFVMDDGTTWAGDSPSAKFTVDITFNGNGVVSLHPANNHWVSLRARAPGGFTLLLRQTSASANPNTDIFGMSTSGNSGGQHLENIHVIEVSNTQANSSLFCPRLPMQFGSARADWSMVSCLWDCSAVPRTALPRAFMSFSLAVNALGMIQLLNNDFRFTLTGVGGAALVNPLVAFNASTNRPPSLVVRGNRCDIGQVGVELPLLTTSGATMPVGFTVIAENNRGLGLPAGSIGLGGLVNGTTDDATLLLDNLGVGGDVKYETRRGYWEFVRGQPVLSATSPTGTLWSWRCFWTQAATLIARSRRLNCPTLRVQNRLGTGARSWNLELLLDSVALANLPTGAEVEVEYVTTGGVPVFERVPITLLASSAAWSNTAAFGDYVTRRIAGTTAQPVLADSMMQLRIAFFRPASVGTAAQFFLDPEPAIS